MLYFFFFFSFISSSELTSRRCYSRLELVAQLQTRVIDRFISTNYSSFYDRPNQKRIHNWKQIRETRVGERERDIEREEDERETTERCKGRESEHKRKGVVAQAFISAAYRMFSVFCNWDFDYYLVISIVSVWSCVWFNATVQWNGWAKSKTGKHELLSTAQKLKLKKMKYTVTRYM